MAALSDRAIVGSLMAAVAAGALAVASCGTPLVDGEYLGETETVAFRFVPDALCVIA